MRIYLDNCCFNRPFDEQSQLRIRLETEAKLEIQARIQNGSIELAWSYILDYENQANPFAERRKAVSRWKTKAIVDIDASQEILDRARNYMKEGIRPKDALHLSCAVAGGCSIFLTTDDDLLRKTRNLAIIRVINPVEYIIEAIE